MRSGRERPPRASMAASASSTTVSVSGRGTKVAASTIKSRLQNSLRPTMRATGWSETTSAAGVSKVKPAWAAVRAASADMSIGLNAGGGPSSFTVPEMEPAVDGSVGSVVSAVEEMTEEEMVREPAVERAAGVEEEEEEKEERTDAVAWIGDEEGSHDGGNRTAGAEAGDGGAGGGGR